MSRRVLVTGGAGLLGGVLVDAAPGEVEVSVTFRRAAPPPGVPAHRVDLAEPGAFGSLIEAASPDLVIHAAYGKVDLERDVVRATVEVAGACARSGARLIHVSTDAVFDGEHAPYDESAVASPITAYGEAKARAESVVADLVHSAAVVRTSLLISVEPVDPTSRWVVDANRRGEAVTLFTDEVRTPVGVADVAEGIWQIAALDDDERAGVWHLGGAEPLSRVELGELLADRFDLDRSLLGAAPSSTVPGVRPRDVSLTSERAGRAIGWSPAPVSELFAAR